MKVGDLVMYKNRYIGQQFIVVAVREGNRPWSKEEKMAMMLESMAPEDIAMLREMIHAKMESETKPQGPPRPAGPMVRPQPMMRRGVSQMG